jgi:hypothetical protein
VDDADTTIAARLTRDNSYIGRPLPRRLRTERETAGSYLAAQTGGLAYMVRLRRIEDEILRLERAWLELAQELAGDAAAFAARWREVLAGWDFGPVNALIASHNRWYPVEARLAMDPRTRDYVLVNGRRYTRELIRPEWVLEHFPPDVGAAAGSPGRDADGRRTQNGRSG